MQKHYATERPAAEGSLMTRLLKRLLALALLAGLAGVVIYASSLPSVQKQFSGRRAAKIHGASPIPVTAATNRNPTGSSCLRAASSAPLIANTATPVRSSQ